MAKQSEDCFYYFAYGSNLWKKRIHVNCPSAEFFGIGQLLDHYLDFVRYSTNWEGALATIVPKENEAMWGAIWKVNNDDLAALDRQEGVEVNEYFAKMVKIITSEGEKVICRTYQNTTNPPNKSQEKLLPEERRPSITYKYCMVRGAMECNLPYYYIKKLKKIPHNGKHATFSEEIKKQLNVYKNILDSLT